MKPFLLVLCIAFLAIAGDARAAVPELPKQFQVGFKAGRVPGHPDRLVVRQLTVRHLDPGEDVRVTCVCGASGLRTIVQTTVRRSKLVINTTKKNMMFKHGSRMTVWVDGALYTRLHNYILKPTHADLDVINDWCWTKLGLKSVKCNSVRDAPLWTTVTGCQPGSISVQTAIPTLADDDYTVYVSYQVFSVDANGRRTVVSTDAESAIGPGNTHYNLNQTIPFATQPGIAYGVTASFRWRHTIIGTTAATATRDSTGGRPVIAPATTASATCTIT